MKTHWKFDRPSLCIASSQPPACLGSGTDGRERKGWLMWVRRLDWNVLFGWCRERFGERGRSSCISYHESRFPQRDTQGQDEMDVRRSRYDLPYLLGDIIVLVAKLNYGLIHRRARSGTRDWGSLRSSGSNLEVINSNESVPLHNLACNPLPITYYYYPLPL